MRQTQATRWRVWQLSWPVILSNLTVPLVGMVDTALMGHQGDPAFVGAIALGALFFSSFYWLFGFLRMGTTGLAAQAFGEAERAVASHGDGAGAVPAGAVQAGAEPAGLPVLLIVCRGLLLALGLAVLLWALAVPLRALALHLVQGSVDVEAMASAYIAMRLWGAPAYLCSLVLMGTLFALQRMRDVLVVSLLINIANLLLSVFFVLVLEYGVVGVALGSVIAEFAGAALAAMFVWRAFRGLGWQLHWPSEVWALTGMIALLRVSLDLMLRTLCIQIPFILFTTLGAGLGDVTLAANAVLLQYFMLATYGVDGFAHAVESLAGYAVGAKNSGALRAAVWRTAEFSVALALICAAGLWLGRVPLVALLTDLAEVQAAALHYVPYLALAPLCFALAFQMDGVFIGMTRFRLLRNHMFCALLVFLGLTYILMPTLGNDGLWLAFLAFFVVRSVSLSTHYFLIRTRLFA